VLGLGLIGRRHARLRQAAPASARDGASVAVEVAI
jgi:hypothetical protein